MERHGGPHVVLWQEGVAAVTASRKDDDAVVGRVVKDAMKSFPFC